MEPTKKTIVSDVGGSAKDHAPRKMTLAANLILTVKLLAGAGAMFAAFWGIDQWAGAK